jgi:hypothetical protein
MPYTAFAAAGTKLQFSASSPITYLDIEGVEGFSGPTGSKEIIDVTAISDIAAKQITGMPKFGQVSFTLFWDPADTTHAALFTAYKTANSHNYFNILCSDTGTASIAFDGSVSTWEWSFAKGAAVTVKVAIEVSGQPTLTP